MKSLISKKIVRCYSSMLKSLMTLKIFLEPTKLGVKATISSMKPMCY